jgi:hypothetical protein
VQVPDQLSRSLWRSDLTQYKHSFCGIRHIKRVDIHWIIVIARATYNTARIFDATRTGVDNMHL